MFIIGSRLFVARIIISVQSYKTIKTTSRTIQINTRFLHSNDEKINKMNGFVLPNGKVKKDHQFRIQKRHFN